MAYPIAQKTLSLIIPLFDTRQCGWQALRSAIEQKTSSRDFEIVAILGQKNNQADDANPELSETLQACDQVLSLPKDPENPQDEIYFYVEGVRQSVGHYLYFLEGHTVLLPGAIEKILAAIRDNPKSPLFWSKRRDSAKTALGKCISRNTQRHFSRARRRGLFSFGGISIIARDYFHHLGGLSIPFGRYNEVILNYRQQRENKKSIRIRDALCIHFNDMNPFHLFEISQAMGKGRYQCALAKKTSPQDNFPPSRHFVYSLGIRLPFRRLWTKPFAGMALSLLYLARVMFSIHKGLAFKLFLAGLAGADLSGFCLGGNPRLEEKIALTSGRTTKKAS